MLNIRYKVNQTETENVPNIQIIIMWNSPWEPEAQVLLNKPENKRDIRKSSTIYTARCFVFCLCNYEYFLS